MSDFPSHLVVREQFQRFFEERGHRIVPSAGVFPRDDATLLFTNAGMNQFKDVFLGTGTREYSRAADTQKCIRASGKHNDLEDVGVDTYHHTFFEMLGNWSFGDYFKRDAIVWAWELLTEVWKLPKERLWVTVFGGDGADGLGADDEAERIWREETDIAPERILRAGREDNFWEMGETGPCGPCSEIHLDRGGPDSNPADGANPEIGVNAGNERFIELWNLVFMQFNRLDDGSLRALPAQCVDTGMGFERVLSVLQGKLSNYDTDLFVPIFDAIAKVSGKTYGTEDEAVNIAFRVIADHVRAVSTAIADGALPGNTGRGYVMRRMLRRASRYGRQTLGITRPFLGEVAIAVADVLGEPFPELRARLEHAQLVLGREEEAFGRTLDRGLVRFEALSDQVTESGTGELPGAEAFELYATYGFPRDLVELMARERGQSLDAAGWAEAQEKHSAASRSEGSFKQLLSAEELEGLGETVSLYHSVGAVGSVAEAKLLRSFERAGGTSLFVLERTPFYSEAGGQIGDRGEIRAADGSFRLVVSDTQRLAGVVVHCGTAEGVVTDGVAVVAQIDAEARSRTVKNHTATHLMHKALREVLGDHVSQAGSYVGPDRLRFDLSHPSAITPEEVERVEALVNAHVFENATVTTTVEDLKAAKERGVTALFGEKYDEQVRVVAVGDWSMELCGGTHVSAAGEIGPFLIVSERAIQAGVRRVEAVTGPAAVAQLQAERRTLSQAARTLKVSPEDLQGRIEALQQNLKAAKKSQAAAATADLAGVLAQVQSGLELRDGLSIGVSDLEGLDLGALRELATRAKGAVADLALVLFGRSDGKVPYLVVCQGSARDRGLKAGDLAKTIAGVLGGGGGGKPELAQGQGLDTTAVPGAVEAVRAALEASVSA